MADQRSSERRNTAQKERKNFELSPYTVLDKKDVMDMLHIGERTLFSYIKEGILKYSQIRGRNYFLYQDILEMMMRFRK